MLSDESMNMLVDTAQYGLTSKDAGTLLILDDGERLDYYLDVVQILRHTFSNDSATLARVGKAAGNW